MGLFEKLEEVRSRPEKARKKLLVIWMTISMAVVIILWLGILRLDDPENKEEVRDTPNPLQVLKDGFSSSKKQIQESFK